MNKPSTNPPADKKCECCRKSDLKPFLSKFFKKAVLVKNFRNKVTSWECRDCFILSDNEARKKANRSKI